MQFSLFAWNSVYVQTCLAHTVDTALPLLRCGSMHLKKEVFFEVHNSSETAQKQAVQNVTEIAHCTGKA